MDDERQVALDAILDQVMSEGRGAFPDVPLSRDVVAAQVARLLPELTEDTALLPERAAEVYFAAGLALGDRSAIAVLERDWLPSAVRSASHLLTATVRADDLRQTIRAKVLLAEGGEPPRIATFAGLGPLAGWLQVVAVRAALSARRERREPVSEEDDDLLWIASPNDDPELDYLRAKCKREFKEAFHEALASLTTDDRNLLRLHLVEGLSIDEIAPMFQIHRATAARRLIRAREATYEATRAALVSRLGLSESECTSIMGLVMSQLDISLMRALSSQESA
jgi:RNA polymerase sigma-70 factor (ECF subfamily)